MLTNQWKKLINEKTGNATFLAKIESKPSPNTYGFVQFFFLIFENLDYREIFESYLRIVSIDYPETS